MQIYIMSTSIVLHSFMMQFSHISGVLVGTKYIEAKRVLSMMNHSVKHDPKTTSSRQQLLQKQLKFQQAWVSFLAGLDLKSQFCDLSKKQYVICKQISDNHTARNMMIKIHRLNHSDLIGLCSMYDSLLTQMKKVNHS